MLSTLLYFLVYLLVVCLVFGLFRYVIMTLAPEGMRPTAIIVLNVIGGILVIILLLALIGVVPGFRFGHHPL